MPAEHNRRIAHLDMDAFYASVELLRYPQLKGLPVVIGGGKRRSVAFDTDALALARQRHPDQDWGPADLGRMPVDLFPRLSGYTGRGVITTATYAARQFGVGSAMGLMKAARLCPNAILLPVDFDEYRRFSRAFKAVITDIAPVMEDRGVDEVYIDFTDVPGGHREGGRVLARLIQKSIFDATGLTCSVGVAPNKLLAKMASEFNKPNGIAIVHETDLQTLIWPLPCRKVNGIGPKAETRLASHGIHTIGDLAAREPTWLREHFGPTYGPWLHEAAWGRDTRPVVTESEPVSISRETTFERDLHAVRDKAELGAIFTRLCEQVADDLHRKGYAARTIGIKLRLPDFKVVTRDHTLATPVRHAADLRHAAGQALKRAPLARPIRLLGVRAAGLCKLDAHGQPVADAPRPTSAAATAHTSNENDLFGFD
ncbi:MAG TPA: DNA polymerase IV [Burkholderiaceae bacterium]|nr:DNA polymerase IV [Burkholderiaceae bacterium]